MTRFVIRKSEYAIEDHVPEYSRMNEWRSREIQILGPVLFRNESLVDTIVTVVNGGSLTAYGVMKGKQLLKTGSSKSV